MLAQCECLTTWLRRHERAHTGALFLTIERSVVRERGAESPRLEPGAGVEPAFTESDSAVLPAGRSRQVPVPGEQEWSRISTPDAPPLWLVRTSVLRDVDGRSRTSILPEGTSVYSRVGAPMPSIHRVTDTRSPITPFARRFEGLLKRRGPPRCPGAALRASRWTSERCPRSDPPAARRGRTGAYSRRWRRPARASPGLVATDLSHYIRNGAGNRDRPRPSPR